MAKILITYDLKHEATKNVHKIVKDAMKLKGYADEIKVENKCSRLPNTSLIHDDKTPEGAGADLVGVCNSNGVTMEKYFCVERSNGRFRSDDIRNC